MGVTLLHHLLTCAPSEAVGLIQGERTFTFGELARRAMAGAAAISASVTPGGRVAMVGDNAVSWIDAYYGVPAAGRVLVLLNHRLAPAELRSQLTRAGAELIVGNRDLLDRIDSPLPSLDLDAWESLTAGPSPRPPTEPAPADVAWLIYTSGTTAAPKGAMLTHASLLAAVAATAPARLVAHDEVYLYPFPCCHVSAYNLLRHHEAGRPVVLVDRFHPASVLEECRRHGVTSASLAATMLSDLLDHAETTQDVASLDTVRSVAYGAAPMPTALLRRASHLLPRVGFAQGYGMTELSGNAVFLGPDEHRRGLAGEERFLAAAGYAAAGVELRLDDGEVLVRAPQVMAGYWDDPEATATALQDGWLRTGDVGRLDEDGLLHLIDRKKDMIVTGGENVASREVEEVLHSLPAVRDVAVIGVPDPRWGENVCAVIVPATDPFDIDAALAAVRDHLAGFKTPRHVVLLDTLPRNAGGKVLKAELRAWLAVDPEALGPRR